jgi:hypothetical protein
MFRLKYFARCAATLMPLLLLLGWGVQTAHYIDHLEHHHSASHHFDNANEDWDGQCTQCRHLDTTPPPPAAAIFVAARTLVVYGQPLRKVSPAGFMAAAYPPLAARPPPRNI